MEMIPADIWYLIGLECDYPTIDSLRRCNRRLWQIFSNQDFWWRMNLQIDRHIKPHFFMMTIDRKELTKLLEEARIKCIEESSKVNITNHFETLFLCLLVEHDENKVMPGFEKILPLDMCLDRALRSYDVELSNYFIEKSIGSLRRLIKGSTIDPGLPVKLQKCSNWDIHYLQRKICIVKRPMSYGTRFDEWVANMINRFMYKHGLYGSYGWGWLESLEHTMRTMEREARIHSQNAVAYQAMPQLAYLWLLILVRYHRTKGRSTISSADESIEPERQRKGRSIISSADESIEPERQRKGRSTISSADESIETERQRKEKRTCRVPKNLHMMLDHIPRPQFLLAIEQMERDGITMECKCLDFRDYYNAHIPSWLWWGYCGVAITGMLTLIGLKLIF